MKDKLVNTFISPGVNVVFKKPLSLNDLKIKYEGRPVSKKVIEQIEGDISYFDVQIQAGFALEEWEKKAYAYLTKLQSYCAACALGSVNSSEGDKYDENI